MIAENTVLIIGAGASVPYGYPTARDLRADIIKNLGHLRDKVSYGVGPLINQYKNDHVDASIDVFLSRHPELKELGKIIIAERMLAYEEKASKNQESIIMNEDWYSCIFGRMTSEITCPDKYESFFQNNIRFITFNYDRSLEEFFARTIRNFAALEEGARQKMFDFLSGRIHHVYGSIAPPSWQNGSKYGDVEYFDPRAVAKRLCIVGDERKDPEAYGEIRKLIRSADQVFFLGFGYRVENLEVLNIPNTLNGCDFVYGTAFQLLPGEINRYKRIIKPNLHDKSPELIYELELSSQHNCKDLLREYLK